jgi:hypothetical protein
MFICNEFTCRSGQALAGMTTHRECYWILHGVAVQNDGVGVDEETIPTQCLLNLEAFLHTLGNSRSVAGMTVTKEKEGGGTLGTFPSCIPLKPRLITTDAGTESGMTIQTHFLLTSSAHPRFAFPPHSLPHSSRFPSNFLLLFPS